MKTLTNLILATSSVLSAFISPLAFASDYKIEHLEPAFWWADMQHEKLQLLVHGPNIADLKPHINNSQIILQRSNKVDSNNYLFLDLIIREGAHPQTIAIDFLKDNKVEVSYDYKLLSRNKNSRAATSYSGKDVIYLITPDRFANGDTSNDEVASMVEGLNRSHPYGRHGGDLAGIIKHLNYIDDMGYTQIWLNPVMENNMKEQSYHGYAITDFYQVDPRYGSNEQLKELSNKAGDRGIGLIKDVVLNHGGLDHWWKDDLPTSDWYNNQGSDNYKATTHFREVMQDPYATASDKAEFSDGWFVSAMPDLNQKNPYMANYLIQNSIWWVEYANLSGIRVDTFPYSDKAFLTEWTRRLTQEYPNINIVGEEWSTNPAITSYWQRGKRNQDGYQTYLPSVMDFPLQKAMVDGLNDKETWGTGIGEIHRMLSNDHLYADPANLVIFPDNHDMSRIFTQVNEDFDLYKMAMTFILTTRGIPQIYYGTEILMSNPGTESHGVIRTDFPGGWPGDEKSAFTGKGLTKQQRDAQKFLQKLMNWRKTATAIHQGKLTHYAPKEGFYTYFRHDNIQKVMVVINKSDKDQLLEKANYPEMLADAKQVKSVLTGQSISLQKAINIPARSSYVFEVN